MSEEAARRVRRLEGAWPIDPMGGLISFLFEILITAALFGVAVMIGFLVLLVV